MWKKVGAEQETRGVSQLEHELNSANVNKDNDPVSTTLSTLKWPMLAQGRQQMTINGQGRHQRCQQRRKGWLIRPSWPTLTTHLVAISNPIAMAPQRWRSIGRHEETKVKDKGPTSAMSKTEEDDMLNFDNEPKVINGGRLGKEWSWKWWLNLLIN